MARRAERPLVPEEMVLGIGAVMASLPRAVEENAWVGTRWRVGQATIAHVFGGEDQLFRITFRAEPDEAIAFQHLGAPYFRSDCGGNVVGMLLDPGLNGTSAAVESRPRGTRLPRTHDSTTGRARHEERDPGGVLVPAGALRHRLLEQPGAGDVAEEVGHRDRRDHGEEAGEPA